MDYEKAYKNALEWARSIYPNAVGAGREDLEHYFPELKESEDEKIRKAIVEFFESQDDNTTYSFIPKKDILAWLEKQGKETSWKPSKEEMDGLDVAVERYIKLHESEFHGYIDIRRIARHFYELGLQKRGGI